MVEKITGVTLTMRHGLEWFIHMEIMEMSSPSLSVIMALYFPLSGGPGRAIGPVCVCLCVQAITLE